MTRDAHCFLMSSGFSGWFWAGHGWNWNTWDIRAWAAQTRLPPLSHPLLPSLFCSWERALALPVGQLALPHWMAVLGRSDCLDGKRRFQEATWQQRWTLRVQCQPPELCGVTCGHFVGLCTRDVCVLADTSTEVIAPRRWWQKMVPANSNYGWMMGLVSFLKDVEIKASLSPPREHIANLWMGKRTLPETLAMPVSWLPTANI